MITCRAARLDEHKALVKLAKTGFHTRDFSNAVMFSSPAAYEKGWIRVAEEEGVLLGYTCVRHKIRAPETVLYFITVAPLAKRRGVGRMLLEDLQQHSPHRRCVLNVANDNPEALAFYPRLGFKIIGTALDGHGVQFAKEW